MALLGIIAGGAAKLAGKLFSGVKRRRERKKIRQQKRELKQSQKLNEQQAGILKSLGINPQGDSTNIPDAPGNDVVAQAGNALLARFADRDKEEEVVTVSDREIIKTPTMSPIMWVGVAVVALALFGKKLFR